MKRMLLGSLVGLVMGLLIAGLAIPAFAQRAGNDASDPWDAMHQACQSGDWDDMDQAAQQAHGGDLSDMPCHNGTDGAGGMMGGGGMTGGRTGGMMGDRTGGMMGGRSGGMMGGGGMMGWQLS